MNEQSALQVPSFGDNQSLISISVKLIIAASLVIGMMMVLNPSVFAQGSTIQTTQASEFSGEIIKMDGSQVTIETSTGEIKQFNAPGSIQITRNGMQAAANELQPGDEVTVQQTQSGEVLSISAKAGILNNLVYVGIPLIILGLLMGMWLAKKKSEGHIKTQVVTSS